jgi:adenine-specific DNA methylase
MTDKPRLIEVAFPLKQASLTSVHEKNVRHGHISTLHIWPARRPLAACRAALLCALLPDPGEAQKRQELLDMIGGTVVMNDEGVSRRFCARMETAAIGSSFTNSGARVRSWFTTSALPTLVRAETLNLGGNEAKTPSGVAWFQSERVGVRTGFLHK